MGQGWARKKFIKWGRIEGLKDMNQASARVGPEPFIKPPLDYLFWLIWFGEKMNNSIEV
jgi:hypothetical protein